MGSMIIKTGCPSCGEVDVTPDMVAIWVNDHARTGFYTFKCPECKGRVKKSADLRVMNVLISAGVRKGGLVADIDHPRYSTDPVLTYDDLLEFHQLLFVSGEFDKWLEDLHGSVNVGG